LESDGDLLSIEVKSSGTITAGWFPSMVNVEVNEGLIPVEIVPGGPPTRELRTHSEKKRWKR